MALARLALKNLQQVRALSHPSAAAAAAGGRGLFETKRFMSTEEGTDKVAGETSDSKELSVKKHSKSSLFPWKHRKRGLWRSRNDRDSLFEFFPSGLGNALIQASENMNRVLEDLNVSPWSLTARIKEQNDSYKVRFDVPGLRKEDLKIVVDDGVLIINGEQSKTSESDDDESSEMYGYYNTSLVLPKDAKADEINATLKNGVLCVTIPKLDKPKKEIKEVQIQ